MSGLEAVELKRADGTAVRIGTDEPETLWQALVEEMNGAHPQGESGV